MAAEVERPIIFPLSNPTDVSEAKPEDLIRWTEGRALVATGSPFSPVSYAERQIPISQCNNIYIFPGVGLGVTASGAHRVTEEMVHAAGSALAEISPARKDHLSPLLPPLNQIRKVVVEIAVAVGEAAQAADVAPKTSREELRQRVIHAQWTPEYPVLA
jgi:malate dehydrogenase (oxaloacetate-decarboxylating)